MTRTVAGRLYYAQIRDAARSLVDDPEYRSSLRTRLISGKAGPVEALLFHYAYGKPKETVEQTGPPQQIVIRIEKPW